MNDGVSKGQGNSRYLKSNIPASTTLQQLISMLNNGTFPVDFNGINEAGWLQIGTALNKANLFSDQTAAKYPDGTETVDGALNLLGTAARYEKKEVPVHISDLENGSIFQMREQGTDVNFVKLMDNYEGSGKTLVIRKSQLSETVAWANSTSEKYEGCNLDTYLNTTYAGMLDAEADVQAVNIKVYDGDKYTYDIKQISRKFFVFSYAEIKENPSIQDGSVIQTINHAWADRSWTRTPSDNYTQTYLTDSSYPSVNTGIKTNLRSVQPMFCLNPDYIIGTKKTEGLFDINGNLILQVPGVKIETITYVGTGTYGSSNPCSVTTTFPAKLLILLYEKLIGGYIGLIFGSDFNGQCVMAADALNLAPDEYTKDLGFFYNVSGSGDIYGKISNDGLTWSWYSTGKASAQFNDEGSVFCCLAIG